MDKIEEKFDKKFDKMNEKFEDKFSKINQKLDEKLDEMKNTVRDIDRRLCRIEGFISVKKCCECGGYHYITNPPKPSP